MKHVTLLAAGTRGDVQPFVALGLALKRAGYSVRLTASGNFGAFVGEHGLEFYPVSGDLTAMLSSPKIQSAMRADNPLKALLSFRTLQRFAFELQEHFYRACEGADAVVYHPGAAIGYFAARQLGVPSIVASPFPLTPTRAYPALVFYGSVRFPPANRLTHRLFQGALWGTSSAPVKRFWKETFGKPPPEFGNPYGRQTTPERPTVVSCSNYVFPRPDDWPAGVYQTGNWFLDEDDWTPPDDLQAFLAQGDPPVYVGFGSMSAPESAEATTRLVLDALRRNGRRGVLATGWGALAGLESTENVFVLGSAPHAWLFPKMAAVVHHGGAGTTAEGLRAGVPNVVVPHALDQFAWGRRVFELGAGPKPIPKRKLTAEGLAAAIQKALEPGTKRAASALGENIRQENGTERVAELIVRCLEAA